MKVTLLCFLDLLLVLDIPCTRVMDIIEDCFCHAHIVLLEKRSILAMLLPRTDGSLLREAELNRSGMLVCSGT